MRVRVLYFGVLKDGFGAGHDEVELAEGSTVAGLVEVLKERAGAVPKVWDSMAVAVNRVYAQSSTVLVEGDEVALLPPVSGGFTKGSTDAD